jgi:hypothetical protein
MWLWLIVADELVAKTQLTVVVVSYKTAPTKETVGSEECE